MRFSSVTAMPVRSGTKNVCLPEFIQTAGIVFTVGALLQLNIAAYLHRQPLRRPEDIIKMKRLFRLRSGVLSSRLSI
jgi:hypothetical protein